MKEKLEVLQAFVDEMKNNSSIIAKKAIINAYGKNPFIKSALVYAYDPYKKYYVTSKTCKKNFNLRDQSYIHSTIFELLNDLNDRTYTGHDAIAMVNTFINMNEEYEDLIFSIIDRNMEIRASSSVINKVIPNLIPTFDVALATKYEPKFCDFENERWLASRKLDGVRCIIRKEGDKVTAYSRQGNEFTTLQKVIEDVSLMSGDFESDIKLSERIKELKGEIHHDGYYDTLSVLDQVYVKDVEHLNDMIAEADKAGYEGIMLRKNVGYQGKRTKNLLKCKKFFDAEYEVLSVDFDIHRIIKEGKDR